MNYGLLFLLLAGVLLQPVASAHRMTEQYIPIGQSPGVSGKYSTIGVIQGYNSETHALMVKGDEGMVTYTMDERTQIYLDRTQSRRTNLKGSYSDCTPGQRVEIMHRFDQKGVALWVKVAKNN